MRITLTMEFDESMIQDGDGGICEDGPRHVADVVKMTAELSAIVGSAEYLVELE